MSDAWADKYNAATDAAEEKALKRQRDKALAFIEKIEEKLKKLPNMYEKELTKINKDMKPYVNKHSWLPGSYRRMLKLWDKGLKEK